MTPSKKKFIVTYDDPSKRHRVWRILESEGLYIKSEDRAKLQMIVIVPLGSDEEYVMYEKILKSYIRDGIKCSLIG